MASALSLLVKPYIKQICLVSNPFLAKSLCLRRNEDWVAPGMAGTSGFYRLLIDTFLPDFYKAAWVGKCADAVTPF